MMRTGREKCNSAAETVGSECLSGRRFCSDSYGEISMSKLVHSGSVWIPQLKFPPSKHCKDCQCIAPKNLGRSDKNISKATVIKSFNLGSTDSALGIIFFKFGSWVTFFV